MIFWSTLDQDDQQPGICNINEVVLLLSTFHEYLDSWICCKSILHVLSHLFSWFWVCKEWLFFYVMFVVRSLSPCIVSATTVSNSAFSSDLFFQRLNIFLFSFFINPALYWVSFYPGIFFCNLVYNFHFDSSSKHPTSRRLATAIFNKLVNFSMPFIGLLLLNWSLTSSSKHNAICHLLLLYFLCSLSFAVWYAVAECPKLLIILRDSPLRYWQSWSSLYSSDVGTL